MARSQGLRGASEGRERTTAAWDTARERPDRSARMRVMDARRRLSALGTGLLCLALLLGALDFHPAEGGHESPVLAGSALYFPGAAHPGQPIHVEEADPVQRPHCAVCLHRLETRGACLE